MTAESVDWRTRFGRSWITSVRSQGGTNNCWAFAATALFEAMVRIEHQLWCSLSEGDVVHGVGKQWWDLGNVGEAIACVQKNGLSDPDCFPFGESAALYTGQDSNGATTFLSPTPDRAGRTMRIAAGAAVSITDPAQKKNWIDQVGPMATLIVPPADFGSMGTQIYVPTTSAQGGAHALLVVGYDDIHRCWIVKNSWGTSWGDHGYGRVSYDAGLFEPAAFFGVRGTNPSPWARRRLRSGAFIQGGNGPARNNFEVFLRRGLNIEHWFRENGDPALSWKSAGVVRCADVWRDTFHDDALDAAAAVHSSFNRNYELAYRSSFGKMRHVFFNQASGWWEDGTLFGPSNPIGMPAFIQSNRGAPGDFEAVVVDAWGTAHQWTKHNSFPWDKSPGTWYDQGVVAQNLAFSGPGLVQSRLGRVAPLENGTGELHFVGTKSDRQMHHSHRVGTAWVEIAVFGANVDSAPCIIEGTYGAGDELGVGNFELCVAVQGHLEHWYRWNQGQGPWTQSAVFGTGARRVLGLIQSTFGTSLEILVENVNGTYQHYSRDGAGWHAGAVIF